MAKPTNLFSFCSLLMVLLFAYSASVQLNDPDWYFWFPLYAFACAVNLMNWRNSSETKVRQIGKTAVVLGVFLFVKVVVEDLVRGIAGILSLDLRERAVREKIGSGLVVISMVLHLEASSHTRHRKREQSPPRWVDYGLAALVTFSYGLPFVSFVIQDGKMKF